LSLRAAAADRTRSAASGAPTAPGEPASWVHQASLEQAFARIFAVVAVLLVLDFWFSAATVSGQSPDSVAADVLLSLLLIWQAARALRRPPSQSDLYLLATVTAGLMLATRILAVPGSPFVSRAAYVLGVVCMHLGKNADARTALATAVVLSPRRYDVLLADARKRLSELQ